MKEQIKKLAPVSVYNIKGMENWLQDLAKEGYRIEKIGTFFVHFTYKRSTTTPVRYRLMPAPQPFYRHVEENIVIPSYWNKVPCQNNGSEIYVAYDEKAEDLYPDDSVKIDILEKICKTIYRSIIWSTLWTIALWIILAYSNNLIEMPIATLIRTDTMLYLCILFPYTCVFIEQANIKKIIKQQSMGWEIPKVTYHPKMRFIANFVPLPLAIFLICSPIISNSFSRWPIRLEAATPTLPIIEMKMINNDSKYFTEGNEIIFFVDYAYSPFAPIQYQIDEAIEIEYNEDIPNLKTMYYRFADPYFAEKFAEEIIKHEMSFAKKYPESFGSEIVMTELSNAGFNRAVLINTHDSQLLIAQSGEELISLRYKGLGDLSLILDQLKENMEAAYKYKPKDVLNAQ